MRDKFISASASCFAHAGTKQGNDPELPPTTGEQKRPDAVVDVLFEVAMAKSRLTPKQVGEIRPTKAANRHGKPSTKWVNSAQLNRPQVGRLTGKIWLRVQFGEPGVPLAVKVALDLLVLTLTQVANDGRLHAVAG